MPLILKMYYFFLLTILKSIMVSSVVSSVIFIYLNSNNKISTVVTLPNIQLYPCGIHETFILQLRLQSHPIVAVVHFIASQITTNFATKSIPFEKNNKPSVKWPNWWSSVSSRLCLANVLPAFLNLCTRHLVWASVSSVNINFFFYNNESILKYLLFKHIYSNVYLIMLFIYEQIVKWNDIH